ncbi:MAG: hypothetical protein GY711_18610 [bacterium]|nr:hypothetical protein [bacterium]
MSRISHLLAGLLMALLLGACAATSVGGVYRQARKDLTSNDGKGALSENVQARMQARYEQLIAWHNAGEIVDADDHFKAGAVLMNSWDQEHLVVAQALGQRAAQLGEPRGNIVAAQAIDKVNLIAGEPQRYGTQNVYVPVLREYRIYEVDPLTTDEDRHLMGIPPLAELHRLLEEQNAALHESRSPGGEPEAPDFLKRPE